MSGIHPIINSQGPILKRTRRPVSTLRYGKAGHLSGRSCKLWARRSNVRSLVTWSAIIEIVAITIWVGGMAALSFIAAPAIFQTATSREGAGKTFGMILRRFHPVMYACGILILAAGAMRWVAVPRLYASEVTRYVIALIMLGLAVFSGLVVSGKLEKLRAGMPTGIDRVPKDDPRRVEFNRLHALSTTLMAFNLMLGLALAILFAVDNQ